MAKITIEIDDDIIAEAIQQGMSSVKAKSKNDDGADNDDVAGEDYTPKDIKSMCEELKEATDAKTLKEVLSEYGVTTPAKAMKLEDDDLQDLGDDLQDAIDEAGGDDDDDEDEITVDVVKAAVQAFTKENGKEETQEILEEFNIKSVRSLSRLDEDDLKELYKEVCQ